MAEVISGKRAFLWAGANNWTNSLLSLAIISALARLVPPGEFGLLGLATIYIALGQVLVNDTVNFALVQRQQLDDDHLHTAFWILVSIGSCLWIVGIVIAPLLTTFFDEPRLTLVLQILSARLVFDAMQGIPLAVLSKRLDFRLLTIRSFVANIIAGLVGIVLAFKGFGVWALVFQQLANAVFSLGVCLSGVAWRPRFAFSLRHAHDLIPFSAFMMLTRACYFAAGNADRFLIGRLMNVEAVGYYSFARRIHEMTTASLSGVVNQFSFPFFSAEQADRENISARVFAVANLTYFITCPAFVGLSAVAPDFIPLLFGEKWIPASSILQVLALQAVLSTTTVLHELLVKALGRADWWLKLAIGGSLLNVIGYLLAAPHGLVAVATSILIVSCLVLPVHWWMVWKLLSFNMMKYAKAFAAPCVAAAGMAVVVVLFRKWATENEIRPIGRVSAEVAVGSLMYGIISIAIFKRRTIEIIRQVISSASD